MPHTDLIAGVVFLVLAVVSTRTGKTWAGWVGIASRTNEPIAYWLFVATYYFGTVWCLGRCFIYGF